MTRLLLAALLAVGLLLSATVAQDPKPKEKAKEKAKTGRIAIDEPTKLKDDVDFATQGEYVGDVNGTKTGVQLIAEGNGKFLVKAFKGGLPGDGWDGQETKKGTVELKDGKLEIKFGAIEMAGVLSKGVLKVTAEGNEASFDKVERKSSTLGAKAPEGAIVLFGAAGDEKNWSNGKLIELSDGKYLNYGIKSKQSFNGFKAHVEFRLPWMPNSRGQGRANSGVYLQDRYEVQVLDSFGLNGENNECAGIYQQYKPLVNMCYPPMMWQTYDIDFTPATFDADGKKTAGARLTLLHNGVKVHDNIEFKGPTGGGQAEKPTPGPLQFQNHGDPLVYRNVWLVEKK
jgi:hypothetical protein